MATALYLNRSKGGKMKQRILKFSVKNQRITSDDISVVADSRNYLSAFFSFDETWDGVEKTAVFSCGEEVYNMLLEGDMCRVPAEVIKAGCFYVSVFGGDLITADRIRIEVTPSGLLEGISPPVPTPDIYNQLVETVMSEAADAAASAEIAVTASQMAQDFTAETAAYAETVAGSVSQVLASEEGAVNAMVRCEQLEEETKTATQVALSAAEDAQNNAGSAYNFSLAAEEAAARAEQLVNYKLLSSGTLDDITGGVASIKDEITEELGNLRELKFYIEFPADSTLDGKTAYLNANISGSPSSLNTFYSTTSVSMTAGKTYRGVAVASIINGGADSMVFGISSKVDTNSGINTRVSPMSCICPWNITASAKQYLNINTNYTFPSGIKWVLEGR